MWIFDTKFCSTSKLCHSHINQEMKAYNLDSVIHLIDPCIISAVTCKFFFWNWDYEDQLVWPWSKNGQFTVKSGYRWSMENGRCLSLILQNSKVVCSPFDKLKVENALRFPEKWRQWKWLLSP